MSDLPEELREYLASEDCRSEMQQVAHEVAAIESKKLDSARGISGAWGSAMRESVKTDVHEEGGTWIAEVSEDSRINFQQNAKGRVTKVAPLIRGVFHRLDSWREVPAWDITKSADLWKSEDDL